jgi:crotonobetaine/carnitine-CoA ligase
LTPTKCTGILSVDLKIKFEKQPKFPVLTFERYPALDKIVTYSDIVISGTKIARVLKKKGIGKGDILSVVMRNQPELVMTLYASSLLGVVMNPIDPRTTLEMLSYQIKNSDSKGVIFSVEYLDLMDKCLKNLPDVRPIGVLYENESESGTYPNYPSLNEILSDPKDFVSPDFKKNNDGDVPIMLIYTSGTTGNPKGVIMRANRFQSYLMRSQQVFHYSDGDILYTGLPLSHANAYAVTLIPSLLMGIPAVISYKFTKTRIWNICREHGCTTFSLLGGMMMGIYSEPVLPNDGDNPVRLVISAGTPKSIWEDFERRFNVKIHEWYGSVEGGFAHKPPGIGPIGSFGKPIEGQMEFKVVREDDTECSPNETGELICRNLKGSTKVEYYGNREASEAKTRGGWLRTGDMVHKDKEGWYYFDYRKGGSLRRQGEFIYPDRIEKVIADHLDVLDVCVYGVPAKSGSPGESDLVAAVVAQPDKTLDIKGIFRDCLAVLSKNSVPSYIQVVTEIPKTGSQKNLERILRETFSENSPNVYQFEKIL